MANITYNRIIRKLVIGFGKLFDDITLVRYNPDLTEAERFIVPLVYAAKEKYVKRLEDDPALDKKIQMALPRMSFEMNGLSYDASRKQNTNIKNFAKTATGVISQYNPVPYNFDFSLYIYVRNIEDGTQIIEHIMPFFAPDYTVKLNLIPEMGIVKEVPVILNSAVSEIDYEGDKNSETRMIIWTLNFTVKGFIFGQMSSTGLIQNSITNILSNVEATSVINLNMTSPGIGSYQEGEFVYQGYSFGTATASARVVAWQDNVLKITSINGNFVSSDPIIGTISNSNYTFDTYQIQPTNLAQIVITPSPTDANANSSYTTTTSITEYPEIDTNVITPDDMFNTDLNSNEFGKDDLLTEEENLIDLG